ncbi:MAG: DUF4212 domain-containing protein [Verrucomicrobiales bacterium]|nr:DUF4212 domain-containing protein [Verrucomicrobiales bacterium]
MSESEHAANQAAKYWWAKMRILLGILVVWFTVSFGCGIIFRDWMDVNMPKVGNAPFGFWMAQQGSIICFVLLLVVYNFMMNRLDEKYDFDEKGEDA